MKRFLAMLCLTGCLLPAARAEDVSLDIQPRVLRLGESATLTLTVEGQSTGRAPALPNLPDVSIVSRGTQTSFQIADGRQSSSVSYTYQVIPSKAGTFSIGPFTYHVDGRAIELPAIQLQVLAGENGADTLAERLFATLEPSTTNLYHQAAFDLTLSVYSQGLNLDRNIELLDLPTTGLRLQQVRPLGTGREAVNNQVYDVRRFRWRVTALTAGEFRLAPTLRVHVLTERQARRSDFFDPFGFFGGGFEARPADVKVRGLTLNVRPLPEEGRPAGFSGAVGKFTFDARVSPAELNAGEPLTLTMIVAGEGNVDIAAPPMPAVGDGFRVYEPKMTVNDVDADRGVGRKVFEQILIPKSDQANRLPPLTFSYFDPEQGRYESQTRGPFDLVVHFSSNEAARIVQSAPGPAEPTRVILGADIGYLKPAPARWRRPGDTPWYANRIVLGLQTVPPLAVALLWLAVRRRDELARDVSKARRQRAPRAARAALEKADHAWQQKDRAAYFERLWDAVASYFGDRFNLAPGEVSRDTVVRRLAGNLDPDRLNRLTALFDRLEQVRFGTGFPSVLDEEDRKLAQEVRDVLHICEEVR